MSTLELGIVSDEIAPDFREAVSYGLKWGISRYELRMLKSGRIPHVNKEEVDEICALIDRHELTITAVSPGLFKLPVSDQAGITHELEVVLPETIEFARKVGSSLIIVFGFQSDSTDLLNQRKKAAEIIRKAAEMVGEASMMLAVENEPGFLCDTGKNTARFIEQVAHPALRSNWDPCNSYGTDEIPFPEGYESVGKYIVNVHAKDTKLGALVKCLPLGEGKIDWPGQIKALLDDRIVDHITIETHCLPLIEQSEKNVHYLKNLLARLSDEELT